MNTRTGRATIVGLGLIGGSLAKALKQAGWVVSGTDLDDTIVASAISQDIIDLADIDEDSDIVFICTPVQSVADQVRRVANLTECPITDVGSVKAVVADELRDLPRFIPGHPMAGNEFSKLAGADPSLFRGATWILTPTNETSEVAYATVHRVLASVLGAKVVSMEAERHDSLMAAVSHVPHFTAAALMLTAKNLAGPYTSTMYALAAGGFRDMTRVSSGDPEMWLDVAEQNEGAVVQVLEEFIGRLRSVQHIIENGESNVLRQVLLDAQSSRRSLPARIITRYSEIIVSVQDRVGALKEVTNLAFDLDVNIFDFEIEHNAEGESGRLRLTIADTEADRLFGGLKAREFAPQLTRVGPTTR